MSIKIFWTRLSCIKGIFAAILFILMVSPFDSLASGGNTEYALGFDFPVGKPDAQGYYDAQDVGVWNAKFNGYHLGEDWNAKCGGDCDLGDEIFAIGNGTVMNRSYLKVWGNILIIRHKLLSGLEVDSFYGHLESVNVTAGQKVKLGQAVGTIGKGDGGVFPAHLHFEIRSNLSIGGGDGYGLKDHPGYLDPSEFIKAHRPPIPPKPQTLTATSTGQSSVGLSWSAPEGDFERTEIYRSIAPGGTDSPETRITLATLTNSANVSFDDKSAASGTTYHYRICTFYKTGLSASSEEISVEQKQEIIKITSDPSSQTYPIINGNLVVWSDSRLDNNRDPQKIFYYDLGKKFEGSFDVKSVGARMPFNPESQGNWIVFYSVDKITPWVGYNIYCYDTSTGTAYPVTKAAKDQYNASVSSEGIVVWEDIRSGNADIYYLDLKTAAGETALVVAPGNQKSPRIWGNKVIYKDNRSGTYDLYVKEIGGGETLIAKDTGESAADICDDLVTWAYKGKLSAYNLRTKEQKVIAATGAYGLPRIRDGKIAYTLDEGSLKYIHIYDIEKDEDKKTNFALNYASHPFVLGNILVFDHSEKQLTPNMDVYLTYL